MGAVADASNGRGWRELSGVLLRCAEDDLRRDGGVDPVLAAFRGDALRFVAWLRPFPEGGHLQPILELSTFAHLLGGDRILLSISARAWSMDDPVVPVVGDADLRQRVVAMTFAERAGRGGRCTSVLHPFDVHDGEVRWHDPVDMGEGEGAVGTVLAEAVAGRNGGQADRRALRAALARLTRVGHSVHLAEELAYRLA